MQRKPFWKLLLLGVGYMALGNVMCTVMTVAASVVANVSAILIVLFILTLFIFYSLCFTVAFKDGQRESRHCNVSYHEHTLGPAVCRCKLKAV